jgi:two-component system sensor histidine kinase UhpB
MRKKKFLVKEKGAEENPPQALPESENRFRQLLENISEGIVIQDKKNIITYANDKFLQMIGYRQDEVIGRPITTLLGKGWLRKDGGAQAGAEKDRWKSAEIAWTRKDGRMVFTILSPKPIYDKQGRFSGSVAVLTDITDRREVEIELRRSHEELRSLSLHLEGVREKESKRIAGEIHDVLGQQLTTLKIDLSWLTERVLSGEKDTGKILEKINAMSDLIGQTIQAVQEISAELRPGMLDDLGLLPAIEWLSQDFQNRTKIKCRTHFDRDDIDLDPDLATAIFRISQEALTNIVRHANATRVQISLKTKDGALVLVIQDNGKGIKKEHIWDPSSLGIIGIRERVRRFSGELTISGTPQKGTTLTAIFPKEID